MAGSFSGGGAVGLLRRVAAASCGGPFDEDATHRLGGSGEEVAAVVPALRPIHIHQAEVSLVNQSRGLERLAGLLLGQPLRRQLPQLVVDQRQELLGGLWVALLDGRQDSSHFTHCLHRRARVRRVWSSLDSWSEFWKRWLFCVLKSSKPMRSSARHRTKWRLGPFQEWGESELRR